MFGIGPIWSLMIGPRIWSKNQRPRMRHSVWLTNLALLVVIGAIFWFVGPVAWLLVQMPTAIIAGTAGVWLFYVQHQFEDVYWESSENWSYDDAALQGSSYLKLPKLLQFFTGNIGLHHVHHLSAKVPNYNLQRAHDQNEVFRDVPVLTIARRPARDPAEADRPRERPAADLERGQGPRLRRCAVACRPRFPERGRTIEHMATRARPLLAPGNEAEWAEINREEERQEAEFATSLSIPERLEFGQRLCEQAFDFYSPSMSRPAMAPGRALGPDLAGVVADANAVGLQYVVIGGFAVIAHGYLRATKDSDLLVPDGAEGRRSHPSLFRSD